MQIIPGLLRHQWQPRIRVDPRPPVQVLGQVGQQRIEGRLAHDTNLLLVQALEGHGRGTRQPRIVGQGRGKPQLGVVRRHVEQGTQFALQPLRLQVQRAVGKPVVVGGIAIMQFAGLEQEDFARRAVVLLAPAMKLLHPLLGHAHQIGIMPMGIIGMPLEMRAHGLDPGRGVLLEIDPVARRHALSCLVNVLLAD
ncbi:hypothetical protein D3C76_1211770 [compost metagenome]